MVNIATFSAEERTDGWVHLKLPPVEELDALLGTEKWKVRKEETAGPFEKVDKILAKGKNAFGIKVEVIGKPVVVSNGIDW
jgi:nitrite reductase (NAD(P)H)